MKSGNNLHQESGDKYKNIFGQKTSAVLGFADVCLPCTHEERN
jgi:hypothetical protein